MMAGLISASAVAGPLFKSDEGIVLMGAGLYIHELTPELARQWLPIIEEIAKES